jgi:nucleoside-diphosphate-sugar epimerase
MGNKNFRIAILGATSEIARDLIGAFSKKSEHHLTLFGRCPDRIFDWVSSQIFTKRYSIKHLDEFDYSDKFDVLINFIGVGNPAKALSMESSILDVTRKYDELAIGYLKRHSDCRYIFISSGAVYGSNFCEPVTEQFLASIPINKMENQSWYGIAKLYAECCHRALIDFGIVDIRIFNYFSHTQDMSAPYLMADICRSISANSILITSSNEIVRDYISTNDLFNLILCILNSPKSNIAIDCYSLKPVKKSDLLQILSSKFGLKYEFSNKNNFVNATGDKKFYFSKNKKASIFGYEPEKRSIDTVIEEMDLYLKRAN